ncbi:alpha/beta fold hydrolase [Caldovatus aquaticus]|uniref:Alpha/beta hydrolase n=1 Tax=Caldovatus aquaticus TaxID=2865671 RepID=A0ABS7EZ01_9PROT|nr:alpha/beta fold hydrolase [Caldovatus aquaticus]MBW8267967.1 alpha/beta hydrolase [Caldovatus aquaticus]
MPEHRLAAGRVRAEVTGDGPVIWLFHSLLADAGSCAPLAQRLAPAHRVVLPDLPGFGGSEAVAGGLPAVADRLAEAVAEAGGGPAILFGNGYGSFVALTLALRHPALVRRLVLAGTGAAFPEPGRAAFRGMAAAARTQGLAAIAETAMRRLFPPEFQAAHPALAAERRARFLATDPAVFVAACEALADLDLRAEVGAITAPTLVLVGSEDEATPPPMARELAALLPDARLRELPGLAHVPQLQDTAGFHAAIGEFLAGR